MDNFTYKISKPSWFIVLIIITYIIEIVVMGLSISIIMGTNIGINLSKKFGGKLSIILTTISTITGIILQLSSMIFGLMSMYFLKNKKKSPDKLYWIIYASGSVLIPGFGFGVASELLTCIVYNNIMS